MDKTIDKSKQEDTIDLLELFFTLLSHWKLILTVMMLCGGIACLYNKYLVKPSYQAKAQIYITNTDQMIDIQNVQLSAALTVDYEEILRSFTVLQKVIDDIELDMGYEELSSMITVLGGILVCGIIILLSLLDMTFKTEEEIESYMNLPVIAVIPVFAEEEKEVKSSAKKRRGKKNAGKDKETSDNKTGFRKTAL